MGGLPRVGASPTASSRSPSSAPTVRTPRSRLQILPDGRPQHRTGARRCRGVRGTLHVRCRRRQVGRLTPGRQPAEATGEACRAVGAAARGRGTHAGAEVTDAAEILTRVEDVGADVVRRAHPVVVGIDQRAGRGAVVVASVRGTSFGSGVMFHRRPHKRHVTCCRTCRSETGCVYFSIDGVRHPT